jgi:hypothetical protein
MNATQGFRISIFPHGGGPRSAASALVLRTARLAILAGLLLATVRASAEKLPGAYFRLIESGIAQVERRLAGAPNADLKSLEARDADNAPWADWRHFPYAILAPAVLYAKRHPDNPHYHDPKMLALALRLGDLCASENEKGRFTPRLDSDWDAYVWLEAYRLLEAQLGQERRSRWRRAIEENVVPLAPEAMERLDFPWYQSPFLGTSPNHYGQWAQLLYLAGETFGKPEWMKLGAQILHRFAAVEQTPDGYWGEHSRAGPTIGYDHLTLSTVAFYWEHSKDQEALRALRRSTDFHKYFTYPDGNPVELLNDRNRYWRVSAWGQFGFSHFPEGRRYAEFLTGFFQPGRLSMDALGRLSQNALYYHEGPLAAIPQDQPRYSYRMRIPAGIRKTGPWVVCLSGIISTQAVNNRFYLDRQSSVSVFHEKLGLIVTGANSKRQPELATFWENLNGVFHHMPVSSRLQMTDQRDRLSLAYNTFFADLYADPPSERELGLRLIINGKGRPPEEARATLQLCLKAGETLATGAGSKIVIGPERIHLGPEAIGGWIRHHGWTLHVDPTARLVWPVYPFNPYADAPETALEHAVGALSVPLRLQARPGHSVRPHEQEIRFTLTAN